MDILSFWCILNNLEKPFCQIFFKTAPTSPEKPLHQRSRSRSCLSRSRGSTKRALIPELSDPSSSCRQLHEANHDMTTPWHPLRACYRRPPLSCYDIMLPLGLLSLGRIWRHCSNLRKFVEFLELFIPSSRNSCS